MAEKLNIEHNTTETKGEFAVRIDGKVKAKITYSKAGNTQIIVDHTEVSDELRGRDVGKLLVERLVEHARANNLRVIPLCPFAKAIIERNEHLHDVVRRSG